MRIAINVTRDFVSGITAANINVLNSLLRNDHEIVGIELNEKRYMKGPALFRMFAPETFDHHIVNMHDLPMREIVKKAKNLREVEHIFAQTIALIRNILKETKPDCLLLNGTYFLPWLISIAAKKEKIPIVLWYAGVFTCEVSHYADNVRKIFHAMEKSIVRRAEKIIFPSDICKRMVEEKVLTQPLDHKNSYVIPNPVSTVFTEQSAAEQSLERRIAAVGRYTPVKNFDRFFDIHRDLTKERWFHTASFVTDVTKQIPTMPRDVKLLPPMTPAGLKRFYLTQGLIICPSIFETFGNVAMEAACLGIPVLVSDTMGCSEVLRQAGLSNMIVDFNDKEAVQKKVKELCGQYILPKQLNALHKLLDYRFIGDEIESVLLSTQK